MPNKTIEKFRNKILEGKSLDDALQEVYEAGYKEGVGSSLKAVESYKPHIKKDGLVIRRMVEGVIKKLLPHQ